MGANEYQKDSLFSDRIDASQSAAQLRWKNEIFGIRTQAKAYQSFKKEYATQSLNFELSRNIVKDIRIGASYKYRSQPLNFNYYLLQSDYREYNWETSNLENQDFTTQTVSIAHPKWHWITSVSNSSLTFSWHNV